MFDNEAVNMGKAVAKTILGDDLSKLDEELEEIYERIYEKNDLNINIDDYPNVLKVLRIVVRKKPNIVGLSPKTSEKISFLINNLKIPSDLINETKNEEYEKKQKVKKADTYDPFTINVKALITKISKNINSETIGVFAKFIFYILFMFKAKGEIKEICTLCGRKAPSKSPFYLGQMNNDYTEDLAADNICVIHAFYHFIANTYPGPFINKPAGRIHRGNNSSIYFSLITSDQTIREYGLFFSEKFSTFVKYYYLNRIILGDTSLRLVFYTPGSQAANAAIHSEGQFNIVDILYKMLNKPNGVYVVNNFENKFLKSNVVKEAGTRIIPFIIEMIQNKHIPYGLLKVYLEEIRKNILKKNYFFSDLIYLYNYILLFYEVKDMNEEKEITQSGWRFGTTLIKNVKQNQDNIENARKFVNALTGTMELSPNTFLEGLLQLQRKYNLYVEKGIRNIADNPKKRSLFLVGLLSGIFSKQSSDKEVDKDE